MRGAPVTLRDFLELGCESSSNGFRSYPRCDAGVVVQQKPAARVELSRSPSWSPSAFFFFSPGNNNNKSSPAGSALARISSLSRSFSQRISFWRRRCVEEYDHDDLDERDSCGFPSPLVSSCCSDSESESESSSELLDIVIEEEHEEEISFSSSSSAPVGFSEPSAASSSSSCSTGIVDHDCGTENVPGAAGNGHDDEGLVDAADPVVGRRKLEDKQQLSPVSVLDFPFDDDDDGDEEERSDAGTCSPSSSCFQLQHHHHHNCQANSNIQRKKNKKKNRRFDDGATRTEAVDLELRFATTSDSGGGESVDDDTHDRCTLHLPTSNSCSTVNTEAVVETAPRHDYHEYEEHQISIDDQRSEQGQDNEEAAGDEHRLLARLLGDDETAAAVDEVTEWLLLDFFAEGLAGFRRRTSLVGTTTVLKPLHDDDVNNCKVTAALVDAAGEWIRGAGLQWGVGDVVFSGESALRDMERSRRWMCVHEEERDVGAEVEAVVVDGLLDELVTDLLAPLVN